MVFSDSVESLGSSLEDLSFVVTKTHVGEVGLHFYQLSIINISICSNIHTLSTDSGSTTLSLSKLEV